MRIYISFKIGGEMPVYSPISDRRTQEKEKEKSN